ncbi:calmodulin (CAM)-binding protein of 25 kDa [Euphorbia peplus]|nr:calmodulin (CAM)-binding protein of 25 kDa [Euphorbia peplus]
MASYDNLEPFLFRNPFADSWISEAYARDTETLTRALQSTFTNSPAISFADSFTNLISSESTTPTISGSSDQDTTPVPASNKRKATNPAGAKVSKRKSRASKKSLTTFITADPANFRQMVQQVTGVRFTSSQLPVVPVLKPEPQRLGNRLVGGPGCLPTLDTSAFLLDQQQMVLGSVSGSGLGSFGEVGLGDGSGHGVDLDCISSFPTLESFHGKLCDI